MSIEIVRNYLSDFGLAEQICEFDVSSATVALAALALGCEEAHIAKTLAFGKDDGCILVVAAGDAKVHNQKFKATFGLKPKMLPAPLVAELTGHPVGGVCPFALPENVPVFLDESLRRFEIVYPAAGTANSAVELNLEQLKTASGALGFVDVCKLPEETE